MQACNLWRAYSNEKLSRWNQKFQQRFLQKKLWKKGRNKRKEKESTLHFGGRCICFPVVFSVGLFTNLRRCRRRGATCTRITTISLSRSFFLYLFTYVFEGGFDEAACVRLDGVAGGGCDVCNMGNFFEGGSYDGGGDYCGDGCEVDSESASCLAIETANISSWVYRSFYLF